MSDSLGSHDMEQLNPWELAKNLTAVSDGNSCNSERSCVFQKASISTSTFRKASHGETPETHHEEKLSPWELAKKLPSSANEKSCDTERLCNFQSASASSLLKASHGENGHHSSSQNASSDNGNNSSSNQCDNFSKSFEVEKSGVSFIKAKSLLDSEVRNSTVGSFQKASSSSVFQKSSLHSASEVTAAKKIDLTLKSITETSTITINAGVEKKELPAPAAKKIPTFGVHKVATTREAHEKEGISLPKIAPKFSSKVAAKKPGALSNSGIQTTTGKNDVSTKGNSDSPNSVSLSSENDAPTKSQKSSSTVDSKKPSHVLKPVFSAGKVHQSKDVFGMKPAATSKNSLEAKIEDSKKLVPTSEEQMNTPNKNIDTNKIFKKVDVKSSLLDKAKSQTCNLVINPESEHASHGTSANKGNKTIVTAKDSLLDISDVAKTSSNSVISSGGDSYSSSLNRPETSSAAPTTIPDSDITLADVESVNHCESRCENTVSEDPQWNVSPKLSLKTGNTPSALLQELEHSETSKNAETHNKSFKKADKTSVKIERKKKANCTEEKKSTKMEDSNGKSYSFNEFFNKVIKNAMEDKLCENENLSSLSKLKKDKKYVKFGKGETHDKLHSKKRKEPGIATHTKSLVTSKMGKEVKRAQNIHRAPSDDRLGCQHRKRSKSESSILPKENKHERRFSESESSQKSTEDSTGSISATSLACKDKINEILESTYDNWVQCDQCNKWRKLPGNVDPSTLPRKWSCEMNPNKEESICEVPEDDWNKENVYVYDGFIVGSVVWARVSGRDWWPAMVDIDPDYLVHNWLDSAAKTVEYYHVTFFEDPVSRGWVTINNIVQFLETDTPRRFSSKGVQNQNAKTELHEAVCHALTALKLGLEERKKKYSFVSRFRGSIGGMSLKKKKKGLKHLKHKLMASRRHLKRIKSDLGLSEDMSCEEEEETSKDDSASNSNLHSSKKNKELDATKQSDENGLHMKSSGNICIMAGVSNGSNLKENENSCNPKEESLNKREAAVLQKRETTEFEKQDINRCNSEGLSEDQDQKAKKDNVNSDMCLKDKKDAVKKKYRELAEEDEMNKTLTLENSECTSPTEQESKVLEHHNSGKDINEKIDKNEQCSSSECTNSTRKLGKNMQEHFALFDKHNAFESHLDEKQCQFLDDNLLTEETGGSEENLYESINDIIAKLDIEESDGNVNEKESLRDKQSPKNTVTNSSREMYSDQETVEKPLLCMTGNVELESQEIPIQYDQL